TVVPNQPFEIKACPPNRAAWDAFNVFEINKRIIQGRQYRKMSRGAFEDAISQHLDGLQDAQQRLRGEPTVALWQAVAKALDVSEDWLLFGRVSTSDEQEAAKLIPRV